MFPVINPVYFGVKPPCGENKSKYPNEVYFLPLKNISFDNSGKGVFEIKKRDLGREYVYFAGITYPAEAIEATVKITIDGLKNIDSIPFLKTNECFIYLSEVAKFEINCSAFASSKRDFLLKLVMGDTPIQIVGSPLTTDIVAQKITTEESAWATGEYQVAVDVSASLSVGSNTLTLINSWKSSAGVSQPENQVSEITITILNNDGSFLDTVTTPAWNLVYFRFRKSSSADFFAEADYQTKNFTNVKSARNNENLLVEINNVPVSGTYRIMAIVKYLYL